MACAVRGVVNVAVGDADRARVGDGGVPGNHCTSGLEGSVGEWPPDAEEAGQCGRNTTNM